ncbi:WecB/TagA/CpsF family glycosyltransferase [Adhaeribacter swui]|uniref:WecB/TagA/CpsF family glycosyltransferase n=1 Tax=Adhaeribacter swui TaxID=2086471 RepID=A0A7G7G583_9BACT|nr:WecB/TagA/CpsF family glycosyltransferase [Adhaeribacter swui]QNF32317.1 WecB/TagA/CpsF family glycosyltransferase [Adhaeribacter swui]
MLRYKSSSLTDFNIFSSKIEDIKISAKTIINTINQYSYVVASKDKAFRKALIESDVLLPDGVGIVFAFKFLKGENIKKIAGADLHYYLLNSLNQNSGSCFYLGSAEETLIKIENRILAEYPNIRVGYYSPPYKTDFNNFDNDAMVNAINTFRPDVLFVGMTAPKQEKWVHYNKSRIEAKVICSIGGAFDFFAGTVNRPGKFWINLCLEWFIRMMKEPGRMWRRYLYYGPVFMFLIIKQKFQDK